MESKHTKSLKIQNWTLQESVGEEHTGTYLSPLVSAFILDPVIRWMYPQPEDYLKHFPRFLRAFAGPAFERGTVALHATEKASALWLPPGAVPDEQELERVLIETVAEHKQADLVKVLEDMDEAHPKCDHWYLPWLGTDANAQGSGYGSELLKRCLEIVDKDALPAYLETPNPRTIPFYRLHGFHVVGGTQHGTCPLVTFMERPAKKQN
ncbi:GNAT family N-acetyltransferase [Alteromonas oceanisediminis]|uniref:GNAT family N-acetyltransferase n=1 Tax=Alteromonas oceanisediminis TaxID=2836180 RepID=UPI001BDAE235|nr:GNAT family N-acetyltransferase [Alteromonas oceanisediminis]MBT0587055.1 GNAT family N-acetyltransferase [Alteromonas oceanisediminis]